MIDILYILSIARMTELRYRSRLPEKGRKETEERVEEMKERDREERRTCYRY